LLQQNKFDIFEKTGIIAIAELPTIFSLLWTGTN